MNIIGIDPGADGAMAILTPDRQLRVQRFKGCGMTELWEMVLGESLEPGFAYLEKVHAFPGQAPSTMFAFGRNLGHVEMALIAAKIPYDNVPPQTWQKSVELGRKIPKALRKKRAAERAKQLFPGEYITQSTADAILIAEHGCRLTYGKDR